MSDRVCILIYIAGGLAVCIFDLDLIIISVCLAACILTICLAACILTIYEFYKGR